MMRTLAVAAVAFATAFAASAAVAAAAEPKMNNFDEAYYTCDAGGAFLVAYDSDKPQNATITTSNSNRRYQLKRTPVASGVQFADDTVSFWTNGASVVVKGTQEPFQNCKIKPS